MTASLTPAKTTHHKDNSLTQSLAFSDGFIRRHLGPSCAQIKDMLAALGFDSLDALTDATVPDQIKLNRALKLGAPRGEHELLQELHKTASLNKVFKSFIGTGYSDTIVPPVILRNILENPGWYTQYTPYQAEISQGRLQALLNFQTMVSDLTGLPLANASLLDEGTAAAEAMAMAHAIAGDDRKKFFIDHRCHPQTIAVVQARAAGLGFETVVACHRSVDLTGVFGALVQYPASTGAIFDYEAFGKKLAAANAVFIVAADILALTLLRPPGQFGADIAVGSTQRFGVPMGYGGPHAGYMATKEHHSRKMPGRLIGVSRDVHGAPAMRLAIQTREQHIKREKATSNICTAQVLLAIMAGLYAAYHGPAGLLKIARRVRNLTLCLAEGIRQAGLSSNADKGEVFDTLRIHVGKGNAAAVHARALANEVNLRVFEGCDTYVGVSLDETTTQDDIALLLTILTGNGSSPSISQLAANIQTEYSSAIARTGEILTHPVFHAHHSEHEMLRYINKLQSRDLSLTTSMISLGSCTMKLNGTSEMIPVTWPQFAKLHPFVPKEQAQGYAKMFNDLQVWLSEVTGFAQVSLQPNAGSAGEYAGLLVIRAFHAANGQNHRNICLIPESAHGTNPASAVIAGLTVVPVACDDNGNIDVEDLKVKIAAHKGNVSCLMITYPSTRGVFEETVVDICKLVHADGAQVYMDGANMNAQVGLCRPGDIGADVCHLNLHKTFCIPHGGGGPGMGPIGVAKHLAPFLPSHPVVRPGSAGEHAIGPVSAAPWGSAAILPIPWVYIALMGAEGLKRATQVAILNANYMAHRLKGSYEVLFVGKTGRVAHEFVIDCRPFDASAGVKVEDIAKRLIDYGFHAPTMSWPVPGTLMIEPTESESQPELDRFCDALILIREEIRAIEEGKADRKDNVLKNAPHTAEHTSSDDWKHPYSRKQAAYPAAWLKDHKFWPYVGRVDNPYGDRNLVCTCPPMEKA
jgi:glycine dehydrogenase